jgi:uracil-DNA glycosylase family 4
VTAPAGSQTGPVPPGTGWPGDPATAATPVAHDAAGVRALAAGAGTLTELAARQSVCRACPRLVAWREQVASTRRRSWRDERYWGRPVPGWGDERPRVLIVGLAPAAHGGNRTGRIFTGDRSGDVLFASLFRAGLAAAPASVSASDSQRLTGARMAAAVRCAPPANKPSVAERDTCAPWLVAEFALVAPWLRVVVCLGSFAWAATWATLRSAGFALPRPRPRFGHGARACLAFPAGAPPAGAPPARGEPPADFRSASVRSADVPSANVLSANAPSANVPSAVRERPLRRPRSQAAPAAAAAPTDSIVLIGCYHPSQQNTFTGRVTPGMLDEVFLTAASEAGLRLSRTGEARLPSVRNIRRTGQNSHAAHSALVEGI